MTKAARTTELEEAVEHGREADVPGRPRRLRELTPTQIEAGPFAHAFGIVWPSAQLELVDFMTRRVEAWARWPSQLMRCRSGQEVWEQQGRFIEDMVRDYRATGGRLMSACGTAPAGSEVREPLH
jgi:hypothetical protein